MDSYLFHCFISMTGAWNGGSWLGCGNLPAMGAVFYLGAGWPQWKPLGIPGTHLPLKRGSWLSLHFGSNTIHVGNLLLCNTNLKIMLALLRFTYFMYSQLLTVIDVASSSLEHLSVTSGKFKTYKIIIIPFNAAIYSTCTCICIS